MATAQNKVLSGLYNGKSIVRNVFIKKTQTFGASESIYYLKILLESNDFIIIDESNVQSIEIVNKEAPQTNVGSSVVSGLAGGILLGGAGLIAGASLREQSSINLLCITWEDEQKSLVEVNGEIFNILNTIAWNIQHEINDKKFTKEDIVKQEIETKKGCFWIWMLLLSPILLFLIAGVVLYPPLALVLIPIFVVLYKKNINKRGL